MLYNYLKSAFRTIARTPTHSFIHVSGLALGIGCALVIFSVVNYHFSFDNFHGDAERIYRFVTEQHRDQVSYSNAVPPAFAQAFRDDYTFGEKVARICNLDDRLVTVEANGEENKFKENVMFVEPEFFDIFNFPLLYGKRVNLLSEPNTAIISQRISKKYFGDESPIDKTFRFNGQIEFKITGVLQNIPGNTDLRPEICLSYASIKEFNEWYAAADAWGGITSDIQSFVKLQPGVIPGEVEKLLPAYVKKYRAESKNVHRYKLQPLKDMHFDMKYGARMPKAALFVVSIIGFFLIFTACLNFINLATAQALNRSREVGVRKTLGSARSQLFWQFTMETALIVCLATVVGFAVAYSVIPYMNEWFATRVVLNFSDIRLPLFTAALMVSVTFLSAMYPGLILSSFKPIYALRGKVSNKVAGSFNLRRVLITIQFVISQILLIGLIIFFCQIDYIRETDQGFDQEGVVMIPIGSTDEKMNTLKDQFAGIPNVENVSLCFAAPASENHWGTMFRYDNRVETEPFAVSFRGGDENYLSTFGIDLLVGRNLTASDTIREFLVNETFVKSLGLTSPEEIIGKPLSIMNGEWKGPVVGVVNDFHDQSFRSPISPVFIASSQQHFTSYAVKINMRNARTTLTALGELWSDLYPGQMYEYAFVDEEIASFYRAEETMLKLVETFSFIALLIGCMGLYGLVSFMAIQKTKEIGIRKVLGGSIEHILWIFAKEFTRLVFISFLIAAPIGWWLTSQWLKMYVYKTGITLWMFALELAIIFFIVVVTVGYESLKSALMNPVKSLRAE